MSDWLIANAGSDAGHRLAIALALLAAVSHAFFGTLQKGRHDPWLSRGAIDFCYGIMAAPIALFVVPWPEPFMWPIFAIALLIHTGYKFAQAQAYSKGAYTVVYPVVRGTGPLITVIAVGFAWAVVYGGVEISNQFRPLHDWRSGVVVIVPGVVATLWIVKATLLED